MTHGVTIRLSADAGVTQRMVGSTCKLTAPLRRGNHKEDTMKIIDDDYMVCGDCIHAIKNDDFSTLDYYYTPESAEVRMARINQGISDAGGSIVTGDADRNDEFSRRACDCCGNPYRGRRYHCRVIMGIC